MAIIRIPKIKHARRITEFASKITEIKPYNKYEIIADLFKNIVRTSYKGKEDRISNDIACRLKEAYANDRLQCVFLHIANEQLIKQNKDFAYLKKRKTLGMIAGAADYVFIGQQCSVFAEVKCSDGKQSGAQKLFEKWCVEQGVKYYIVRSWDELQSILMQHGLLKAGLSVDQVNMSLRTKRVSKTKSNNRALNAD